MGNRAHFQNVQGVSPTPIVGGKGSMIKGELSREGEEIQPVFTVEFLYHDQRRRVINATVKRDKDYNWYLIGLEEAREEKRPSTTTTNLVWVKTGVIKSYKWDEILACMILDVYEYEG